MESRTYRYERYDNHFRLKVVAYHMFSVYNGGGMYNSSELFSIPLATVYKWKKYFLDKTLYSEFELIRLGRFIDNEANTWYGGNIISGHLK